MVLVHIRWGSEQKKTTGGLGLQFRLVFGPFRACFWPKLLISLHIVRKYFVVTKTVLRHCFWELGNETIGMVVLHDNVIKSEGWHFVCVIEGQNYRKIAKIAKRCLKNENTIKKKRPALVFFTLPRRTTRPTFVSQLSKLWRKVSKPKYLRLSRAPARLCRFTLKVWVNKWPNLARCLVILTDFDGFNIARKLSPD